jgi:RND superfamily putative drug exporter
VTGAARRVAGVAEVTELVRDADLVQLAVVLADPPDSAEAVATIPRLREAVHAVPGADALVGGPTAVDVDTRAAAARDRVVIIPLVLVVVFLVIAWLLRALLVSALLLGSVVLSFAATLGIAAIAFNYLFKFPGADPSIPLFGFLFLVALGVDYSIFLLTRAREEALTHGTRAGIRASLALTGGVITSAGVVLAATFSALGVVPILFLAQIGFLVAIGVLIDTMVVRSLLVPGLCHDIGDRIWWPSRLARTRPDRSLTPPGQT